MKEPLASDLAGLRLEVSTPGSTGNQADERAGDLQTKAKVCLLWIPGLWPECGCGITQSIPGKERRREDQDKADGVEESWCVIILSAIEAKDEIVKVHYEAK